jgi:tetratricopeptide (TPR) repeat protein
VYYVDETYIVDDALEPANTGVIATPYEATEAPIEVTAIGQTVVPYADGTGAIEDITIEQGESEAVARPQDSISSPPLPPDADVPTPGDAPLTPLTEPTDVTWVGKGNTAFLDGQYEEARRCYISAVMADERDGYAKFLYAVANFAVGDFEVAGVAMRRALLTTADLIEYPVDIRSLYSDRMVLDAQFETLTGLVADHPDHRDARLLLGYLYYASGDPSRALAVLESVAASDGEDEVLALVRDAAVRVSQQSTGNE